MMERLDIQKCEVEAFFWSPVAPVRAIPPRRRAGRPHPEGRPPGRPHQASVTAVALLVPHRLIFSDCF
jgi:hypothetical protein